MHLRPAKYTDAATLWPPPPPPARPASRQPENKSSVSSSSMDPSPIDSTDGGGGGSINNNNQAIQFTASVQPFSPAPAAANRFNGKLNEEHNNPLLTTADRLPYRRRPNGSSKLNIKLFSPATAGPKSTSGDGLTTGGATFRAHNHHNSNDNGAMSFFKRDRLKLMELSVINLVELSTMAADEGKQELGLDKARAAVEAFNSLKVAVMAQDRMAAAAELPGTNKARGQSNESTDTSPQSESATAPMTTGVSLYELSLMVNSNLAAQLANNGHLDESIDLYSQLCKTAGGGGGSSSNQATMIGGSSSGRSQHETRFLLYRFGLNIGNIYYAKREYQRALKYYRLTLDRLAASSAYRSLKVKIMNNIGLALLALNQPVDAATSLNLLLSDNLVPSSDGGGGSSNEPASSLDVCNANHHEFGLNLMVCHHQRADLNSLMATLKALVQVGVYRHYERVFDLPSAPTSFITSWGELANDGRNSSGSSSSTVTASASASAAAIGRESPVQIDQRSRRPPGNADISRAESLDRKPVGDRAIRDVVWTGRVASSFLGATKQQQSAVVGRTANKARGREPNQMDTATADEEDSDHSSGSRRTLTARETIPTNLRVMGGSVEQGERQVNHGLQELVGSTELSTAETRSRQLMRLIQGDKLEKLIVDKHNQISHALIMGCNLILDLDSRITQSNQSTWEQGKTSALEFCLRLLATSEHYKSLTHELKANSVSGMLMKKYKLDEAIAVLREMDREQQVDKRVHKDNTGRSMVKNLTSNRYLSGSRGNNNNTLNKNATNMIHKSSVVATNCSSLNLLQGNTKKASEYGYQALARDKFNVLALTNLANSYFLINELDTAETLYQRALLIDPDSWEANYNLVLLVRKQKRHYSDLKEPTKLIISKYYQSSSSLIWHKLVLAVIQIALVYHQSGLQQHTRTLTNDLLSSSRLGPEVLLLASRLIDDPTSIATTEPNKPSVMTILQQANRDHPYHLPVAERLIALNIQSFNYEKARALLCTCIVNRPDQVKWYQMLAECYRRAADYNKAIAAYQIAVDAFPQDTSCLKALIKLTDELGLNEEKRIFSNKLERALRRLNLSTAMVT